MRQLIIIILGIMIYTKSDANTNNYDMILKNISYKRIDSQLKPEILDAIFSENKIYLLVKYESSSTTNIRVHEFTHTEMDYQFQERIFDVNAQIQTRNLIKGKLLCLNSRLQLLVNYVPLHSPKSASGMTSRSPLQSKIFIEFNTVDIKVTSSLTPAEYQLLNSTNNFPQVLNHNNFESNNFSLVSSFKHESIYFIVGLIDSGSVILIPDFFENSNSKPFSLLISALVETEAPTIALLNHQFDGNNSLNINGTKFDQEIPLIFNFRTYNLLNQDKIEVQFINSLDPNKINKDFEFQLENSQLKILLKRKFRSGNYDVRLHDPITKSNSKIIKLQVNNDSRNSLYYKLSIVQLANGILINILILCLFLLYLYFFNPELMGYEKNPFNWIIFDPTLKEPIYSFLNYIILTLIVSVFLFMLDIQKQLQIGFLSLFFCLLFPIFIIVKYLRIVAGKFKVNTK